MASFEENRFFDIAEKCAAFGDGLDLKIEHATADRKTCRVPAVPACLMIPCTLFSLLQRSDDLTQRIEDSESDPGRAL